MSGVIPGPFERETLFTPPPFCRQADRHGPPLQPLAPMINPTDRRSSGLNNIRLVLAFVAWPTGPKALPVLAR